VQRDASRRVEEQTIFMLDARPADKQDNAASAISQEAMPKATKAPRFLREKSKTKKGEKKLDSVAYA
jgi:tRNA nucleotidyltransferase (CCA-adding enzyme)